MVDNSTNKDKYKLHCNNAHTHTNNNRILFNSKQSYFSPVNNMDDNSYQKEFICIQTLVGKTDLQSINEIINAKETQKKQHRNCWIK